MLQDGEDDGDDHSHIKDHGSNAQTLDAKEVETAAVKDPLFRGHAGGEEAGEDSAQGTADAMDRDGAHRVVNLGNLVEELHGQHDDQAENNAHNGGTQGSNGVAPGGDAHQACQSGVVGHGDIRLAIAQPGEDQGGAAGHGGAEVGVEEHQTGADDQLVGVHAYGGGTVEAEPAEPENEHAQSGKGQVVA